MIETMIAIIVLGIGVMSLATLVPYATRNDYRSRIDTTATFLAMQQLEKILAQPFTAASFTDDGGVTVNLTAGGRPLVGGNIDFSGTSPAGYSRTVTITSSGGRTVNATIYEIRWNIAQSSTTGVRTIVIASRPQALNLPGTTPFPANLRAVKMK